ncbi:hypothetical protein J2T07_000842 [Luteibacter jiangsuensis]|uniref:Uncharacterized protein n=1 Tax=Luteibacter jiangsuensis TaxID=637577 RepID=A0ABT9SUM0_9GAMM|nr:hypothetical protein [Luteibacter jiangsuensis]MDQ0008683.1 hypothetical protein [Luteibacter jiangsuensis]
MKNRIALAAAIALATSAVSAMAFAGSTAPVTVRSDLMPVCDGGDGGGDPWADLRTAGTPKSLNLTASIRSGLTTHAPTGASVRVIGADEKSVDNNFGDVIEANFAAASTEQLIGRLSDKELAAIAKHYQRTRGTHDTPLLSTFAKRLSDKALLRVARAFDSAAVRAAVTKYSGNAVRASFAAQVSTVQPDLLPGGGEEGGGGGSAGGGSTGGGSAAAAPTTDMTLEEIYLDFRTAPVGSLSPASALSETTLFASQRVLPAAAAGTAIGTGINYLIENYDPSLSDAIGGTIAGSIEAAQAAITEVERGHYQSAYDALFGYPVTNTGGATVQFDADWNVAEPMQEYYDAGGGCGW